MKNLIFYSFFFGLNIQSVFKFINRFRFVFSLIFFSCIPLDDGVLMLFTVTFPQSVNINDDVVIIHGQYTSGDPVDRMRYVEYQIFYAIHMSIHYFHMRAAKITAFDRNNLIFHVCKMVFVCMCIFIYFFLYPKYIRFGRGLTFTITKMMKIKSILNVWNCYSKFECFFLLYSILPFDCLIRFKRTLDNSIHKRWSKLNINLCDLCIHEYARPLQEEQTYSVQWKSHLINHIACKPEPDYILSLCILDQKKM